MRLLFLFNSQSFILLLSLCLLKPFSLHGYRFLHLCVWGGSLLFQSWNRSHLFHPRQLPPCQKLLQQLQKRSPVPLHQHQSLRAWMTHIWHFWRIWKHLVLLIVELICRCGCGMGRVATEGSEGYRKSVYRQQTNSFVQDNIYLLFMLSCFWISLMFFIVKVYMVSRILIFEEFVAHDFF